MAIYQVDITGTLAANRITNEQAVIQAGSTDIHKQLPYIIPQFAPFFGDSLVLRRNGQVLTKNVDYQFAAQHLHARDYLGKEVWGAIVFLDRNAAGNVSFDYNTLGGDYVTNDPQMLATYFSSLLQQRTINWDVVYGVPALLPPIQGQTNLSSLKGVDDIVTELQNLVTAMGDADVGVVITAINNLSNQLIDHSNASNAHGTTKEDVQLGLVENLAPLSSLANLFDTATAAKTFATAAGGLAAKDTWAILRNGIFQPYENTVAQAPADATNAIFLSDTLEKITLPNDAEVTGSSLIVLQMKVSGLNVQAMPAADRVQIGFLYNGTDQTKGYVLIRYVAGGTLAASLPNWTVMPNLDQLNTLLTGLDPESAAAAIDAKLAEKITYGTADPTASNFTKVGDIYLKLEA